MDIAQLTKRVAAAAKSPAGAGVPHVNAQQSDVGMVDVATLKLQGRKVKKRARQAVKRDPKTGQELKNEWQRDTDIMYYLSSGNVARIKEEFDQKSREYKGEGLTLVEFVFVMIKCLGAFVVNQVDFVVQAVDLFRQVDVNDDGSMTWDEFTSYIVEAGLAQGGDVENTVAVQYRYKFIQSVDHNVHNSFIQRVYRLPAPLNCVAAIEAGSEMLKLYRPSSDPSRAQLKQMKLVRHDTAYSPHEVLTCLAISEACMLVTASQQALTGPFHISFWDADTLTLKHRVSTQTPHTVMCWSQRAQTLFSAGHGVGAGTSSPIIAWSIKTFQKLRSLVWHTSHVTDMVEIPGNVMNHLVSASHDGSLVLWDMRKYACVQDRVIIAHEFGVRAVVYSQRLGLLASYGSPGNPSAGKALSCYAVHLWDTASWVGRPDRLGADAGSDYDSEDMSDPDEPQMGHRRRPRLLMGHSHPVIGVVFQDEESAPGPAHIVSADVKGIVRVWHAESFECLQTLNVVRVPEHMRRKAVAEAAGRGPSRKQLKAALLTAPSAPVSPKRTRRRRRPASPQSPEHKTMVHGTAFTLGVGSSSPAAEAAGGGAGGISAEETASLMVERPKTAQELVAEARRSFSPVMLDRTIADEYEVVSNAGSDDDDAATPGAAPLQAARAGVQVKEPKYLHRLDCILALPPSATAANISTVILCGDGFRMMRLHQIVARPQPLVAAEFNPTSFTFVTATARRITVWDAISGRVLRAYPARNVCSPGGTITSVCLDGRLRKFIVGDSNGCIRVLNFTNGAMMKELDPHEGVVSSLVYSKEDGCVISTSWDSTVHVCDERHQYGFSREPAFRSVLLRRAKLPPLDGISELADEGGFEHVSIASFETSSDEDEGGFFSTQPSSSMHHRPSRASMSGTGFGVSGSTAHRLGEGITRQGFASVDVTITELGPHLNLFACAARGMNNSHMILLWRYDKTILNGACVPTGRYRDNMAEVTALAFLEPFPLLCSASADGNLFLWAVAPHEEANVAKAVWSAPPKYRKSFVSIAVVDTSKHPLLNLRASPLKRRFSVLGCSKRVGRGFVLFTGDETGVIHRWELSLEFLTSLKAHEAPRAARSATVERRMGRSLIPQHTLAGVVASVRQSKRLSKIKPVEGAYYGSDDTEASTAGRHLPVWCGCWQAHDDAVSLLQWMPQSETVLSGSADGYARVWSFDGLLLGTLDPNPRNQPARSLDPEELTRQLAAKLKKEAEQKALFRESSVSTSASATPSPSRPGTASGAKRSRAVSRHASSLLVESDTQALLRKAAEAVKQRLDAEKLHIPDVLPAPKSLLQYDECESMYQFAFMLGTPPAVGPVKWHLTFDLEERRRKDEREAHVILPNARLLHSAKTWKRKTILRHQSRKKVLKEAQNVLEEHGLSKLANDVSAAVRSSQSTVPGVDGDDDGGGDDSSSSGSVASVLMADEELIAAQERLNEPRLTADGRDPLLGMLNGLGVGDDEEEVAPRRASRDPIRLLMKVPRQRVRTPSRRASDTRPEMQPMNMKATGGSQGTTAAAADRPGSPVARMSVQQPPHSPMAGTARTAKPAGPGAGAGGKGSPGPAASVDSVDMDSTNEYLANYSALGHRSRLHKDFSPTAARQAAAVPTYFGQYSNLKSYKSLLPPTAMPSSPNDMGTRIRKRKKPTLREIMGNGNPLAATMPLPRRPPMPGLDDLDVSASHSMLHHPELKDSGRGRPRTSSVLRYVRSSSIPALKAGTARTARSGAMTANSGLTGRTGAETRHGRYDQADLWADEAGVLDFSHAAGPGTWGGAQASPDPLRPGLIMFDRNPRSAVDSGGTRYPPILSASLRPTAASSAYREMENEWRRNRPGMSGRHVKLRKGVSAPTLDSSSRLGRSLRASLSKE